LREPLLWFFIVGAILFGADSYFSQLPARVVVDASVRDRLDKLWEVQTGRPATQIELDSLVKNWIREEVLYREALRLGLDRDDSIVRRRLVQKLGFLVEEVEEEEDQRRAMEKYYEDNIAKYSLPVRYSFSQIFFGEESRAAEIQTKLDEGADWRGLSETSMLSDSYVSRNEKEIAAIFGRPFAGYLYSFVRGKWVGPIRSSFGFHLVRLERILPTETTPMAYIERKVFADYLQFRQEVAVEEYYQDLLDKYDIVLE
jgi:peptidyl-prolyl cis-trans isomerase C